MNIGFVSLYWWSGGGDNSSSTGLQMMPNLRVQSQLLRAVLTFRAGPRQNRGMGQQESLELQHRKRQSLAQVLTLCTGTGWGLAGWGADLLKRPWGSGQTASWTWASSLPWQQRRQTVSWAASAWVQPANQEMWLFLSAWHLSGHTWTISPSFAFALLKRDIKKLETAWWMIITSD